MKYLKRTMAMVICLSVVVMNLNVLPVIADADNTYDKRVIIPNDDTGIPDNYLYQEILWQLDCYEGYTLTKDDIAGLDGLEVVNYSGKKKIKTLKGIEKFVHLRSLGIADNALTNLKGVECLTNLEELSIGKGNLKNIDEIKSLTKLKSLSLNGIKLEDWSVLSNLTNLESLNITDCGLTGSDLENIVSKMTKLTSLGIAGSNINDLKSISGLTQLTSLSVNNSNLTSLNGVENLTKLENLDVSKNKLTNLNGIESLTKLMYLDVSENEMTTLPSLKKLTELNLEYSRLGYNKISEEQFKQNLPAHALEEKWWVNNQILLQNLEKKLKVNKVKKIKSKTKKITGVTEKKAIVILKTSGGKKIKKVKADKKGIFAFNKLDLKKYKGKKLKITAYLPYDDQINSEYHLHALKTVKFTVRKK